jgi:hypothetical protein
MKSWIAFGLVLACGAAASAQQSTTVQMQCRDLASTGNVIGPDETFFNGMACKTIKQVTVEKQVVNSAPPAGSNQLTPSGATVVPASLPVPATEAKSDSPQPTPQPVTGSDQIASGARIVIAPMGGFETYFAAAVREKKVPVTLTLDKDSAQFFVVSTETEWHGFVFGSGGSANWNQNGGSAAHGSAGSSTRGLEASIMLIDARTKDVVWAYEVHKNSHGALLLGTHAARGQQSLAEACAKHLKEFIEKGK